MAGKSRDAVSLGSIYSEYTGSSHKVYPTGKSLTASYLTAILTP